MPYNETLTKQSALDALGADRKLAEELVIDRQTINSRQIEEALEYEITYRGDNTMPGIDWRHPCALFFSIQEGAVNNIFAKQVVGYKQPDGYCDHRGMMEFADVLTREALINAIRHGTDYCRNGNVDYELWHSRIGVVGIVANPAEYCIDIGQVPQYLEKHRVLPGGGQRHRGAGGNRMNHRKFEVGFELTEEQFRVIMFYRHGVDNILREDYE